MYIRSLLSLVLRVIAPLALCSTLYLYLYPIFHGCAFPSSNASLPSAFRDTIGLHGWIKAADAVATSSSLAPFRLLVLADPQLEGDSSLPEPEDGFLPRLARHWSDFRKKAMPERKRAAIDVLQNIYHRDIPDALYALRKRLDLFGNDYYLAHIYRTLHWWTKPTHVTVLGDLIGSQWVTDEEFAWRGWRYWNRVFAGGRKGQEAITATKAEDDRLAWTDDNDWGKRIINIAGNHDIGYAGDISRARLERFERVFGKANWDIRFEYPSAENATGRAPSIHLIILNSLNLDTPALDEDLQRDSYEFINSIISDSRPVEDRTSFTLLLTHLPLHKEAGVCVDAPYFGFWEDDNGGGVYRPHGLKEQNHLSDHGSRNILQGLFGLSGAADAPAGGRGRAGVILNGHDHEGCDVWHYINASAAAVDLPQEEEDAQSDWQAVKWKDAKSMLKMNGIREVTMRSMMGEFDGNAGLLSAWYDNSAGEWQYDIQMCKVGVQHIWWAIHVLDILTVSMIVLRMVLGPIVDRRQESPQHIPSIKPAEATGEKLEAAE